MAQPRSEARIVRMFFPEEWQRQAFDAFLVPLDELGLTDSEKSTYVRKAARAVNSLDWENYLATRGSFMLQAMNLLEVRPLQYAELLDIRGRMFVRFMEGRIQYFRLREQAERCPLAPIPAGDQDFHNTVMAAVFAHLPEQPEIRSWLKEIDVRWNYEQLHMVTWFSGQLTLGSGKYSRSRPNHSAKVTYERLVNPYSLLWIAAALGEDKDLVIRAGHEMKAYATCRAKCGVVRRAIPWKRIYELAKPLADREG